ncbi:MAG: serine/threonine-protein kinase [Dehalococcoidia bacterium]
MKRYRPESRTPEREARFVGPYRVVDRIGTARFGTDFRVRSGNRLLVLRLLDGLPRNPDGRLAARFNEIMTAAREFRHPNIIPLLDFGNADGIPYLVTDDHAAGTLADHLGSPQSWREVLPIAQDVAEALDFAHARGAVHGGLEPATVLRRADGTVALAGFGLAQVAWLAPSTHRAGLLAGQFHLSPEQRAGDPATTRSDVWAYAALVYELLTGRPPVPLPGGDPPAPTALVGGLGSAVDQALLEALATDPARRPLAAGLVLRALCAGTPQDSRPRAALLLHHRRAASEVAAVLEPPASLPESPRPQPTPPTDPPSRFRPRFNRARLLGALVEWVQEKPLEAALAGLAVLILGVGFVRFGGAGAPATSTDAPLSTLTTSSPAGAWTMAGQNPARTAFAPEAATVLEGRVAWQQTLGAPITAPPIVANGLVLVGLADGRVVARDLVSGNPKWEYKTSGSVEAGPAVADGLVFIGQKDGKVVAIDAAGGGMRWEFRTGGPVSAAPLAVDGILYAASNDGTLSALDAAGGSLRWRYDAGSAIDAPPAAGNGMVVVATRDGRLHLLDARSGAARWVYRTGGGVDAPPLLAGGFAYAANERGVVQAIDPFAKGAPFEWELREIQAQLYLWGLPVGLPGPQPGYKWSVNVASPVKAAMAAAGAALFVPGSDGKLSALNALDGKVRWQHQFGGPVAPPIVAGDLVYAGAEDKRLVVLGAASGEKILEIALAGKIRVSPALARGLLLIGTEEGKLYAIK